MRVKWIYVTILVTLANVTATYAQTFQSSTAKPNFCNTIPSVDAASLGLYADIPVSLYTGTPEISIPLYEIKLKDFTLPVSLSYHASGIKLAQEASSVGLGWVLNAGGVITRTVRDKDDMDFKLGFKNSTAPFPHDSIIANEYYSSELDLSSGYLPKVALYNETEPDTEPDMFSYNFNGITGHFVFIKGGNGSIMDLNPENMLKIEYKSMNSFGITTPDGTIYNFAPTEQTIDYIGMLEGYGNLFGIPEDQYRFRNSNIQGTYISWYLTEITLLNGDNITFQYNYGATYPQSSGYETFVRYSYDATNILAKKQSIQYVLFANSALTYSKTVYYNVVVPEKITWKNGYIQFNSSDRHDLKRPMTKPSAVCRKVDGMKIYGDGENNPAYSINFYNSYFGPAGTVSASSDKRYYRLRLDSLQVTGGSENILKYKFGYSGATLPPKDGFGSDRWGFINNTQQGNKHDIMTTVYAAEDIVVNRYEPGLGSLNVNIKKGSVLYNGDGNKNCNASYIKFGTLTSITYPTGSTTQFEYEPHDFGGNPLYNVNTGGGIRIKKISSENEVRDFEYKLEEGISSGLLINPATYYDTGVIGLNGFNGFKGIYYLLNVQSDMFAPMETAINGVTVGYTRVVESRISSSGNVREENFFYNIPVSTKPLLGFPVQENIRNGKLYYKKYLDNNNQIVKSEEYSYQPLTLQILQGYKQNSFLKMQKYMVKAEYTRIARNAEYNYSAETENVTDYEYSSDGFPLPYKITVKSGAGTGFYQTFTKTTHYSGNLTQGNMPYIKSQNRIALPIEEVFTLNGKPMLKRITTYDGMAARGLNPGKIFECRNPTNASLNYTGLNIPPEYNRIAADFRNYDIKGNCIQFIGEDNIPVIMLYDKRAVTPVAIIRGASLSQVSSIVNPDDLVTGKIDFDVESLYTLLPDAEIQTAKYNRLSSPVMIKQPSGFKLNFVYDCMGRLTEKRDADNNIINAYKYNYINK